jgi:signal transduction histidine kinase
MSDETGGDQKDTGAENLSPIRQVTSTLRRILPGVIRRNYLVKFGIAVLFVFVLISVAGIATINDTTETLDRQVSQQLQTEASTEADEVHAWRDQRSRWLNELSKTRAMQSEQTEPIRISLQQGGSNFPDDVRFVHFINVSSNEILASNERRKEGTTLSEEALPRSEQSVLAGASDVYVSETYREEGIPAIAFATVIPERPNRAIVGVTRSQYSVERTIEGTDRFITVIDENGRIVMDTRGNQFVGQQYTSDGEDLYKRLAEQDGAFLRTAPNQQRLSEAFVAAYSIVEQDQWIVLTHAAEDEAYLLRSNIISDLITLLLVSLVGLALLGLVFAGGTVRSINKLAERVKALEQGDLDVPLQTSREDEIGRLYSGFESMRKSLRDQIDELENQQVIISVLNRILRHNLRNSLTSILLQTQQVSDSASAEQQEKLDTITSTSDRLLRRVEKSKRVEKIVGSDTKDIEAVDVAEIVGESIALQREEHPDATITEHLSEGCYAKIGSGLSFIVDNLVENAIQHNDSQQPAVTVTVQSVAREGTQWIELLVEDNGPGIPDIETAVLDKGKETPLEHGSGVGLWLINWLVDHVDGDLSFEENDPRGTRVVVRFPAVQPATLPTESRAHSAKTEV